MKTKITLLILAALALLLPSCSFRPQGQDQFDIGLANAMQQQATQAREASQMSMGAPMRRLQPLAQLEPIR